MFDVGHRDVISPLADEVGDDDRDASTSIADTDATEMSGASEVTSHGSLTSVD